MSLLDITPLVIMRPRITSTTIEKAQEIMHLYSTLLMFSYTIEKALEVHF